MVIIIGGGVFGLSIGWDLARVGQAVTVVEQDQAGRGATWAAAGMLMPWKLSDTFSEPLFELQRASRELWPDFAAALSSAAGIDLDYQTGGRYFVAITEQSAQRLRRQFDWHRAAGLPVEWLAGDEARQRAPYLGPKVNAAIFTPLAHQVDNRRLAGALRAAFVKAGGLLHEQAAVQGVLIEAQRVRGVRLAHEVLLAEVVIVAAGAWSGQVKGLPAELPHIHPRKGQTVILQMVPEQPLVPVQILGPTYLVPRSDGRLVIGTTMEREAGFDTRPTAGGIFHILRKAIDLIPGLEPLPILELGAGLRPTGPDRLPILGPTAIEGLAIATGGHSSGILLAPAVAQAMKQWATTGHAQDSIKAFLP
jgi:glycine oxidase